MSSLTIRREGPLSRQEIEPGLRRVLAEHSVLRLKGRLREPGKRLPLQIQAVGRRLECWYEGAAAAAADGADGADALELVVLAPASDAARLEEVCEGLWRSASSDG